MKVSIITATYNSSETIRDTIESVLCQTYKNIEHIIIDGASKDGTLEIVHSYGGKIAKVISEPDGGIYDAMNKGISMASGDVVGILNSDDFFAHDRVIEKVVRSFEMTECDSAYGDLQYVDPSETAKVVRNWRAGRYTRNSWLYGWMLPHPTFYVRKDVYERFGTFNLRLRSAADYEIMLRFLYKNKISATYIPEVLVRMRTGGVSNSSIKNRLAANKEDRQAWRMNGLTPRFYTTLLKPIRKIGQFV
ncbi:MAG: glycosyltransferase family 2 protein [Bacteroidota bacterium]